MNTDTCSIMNRYIVAVPKKWLDLEFSDDEERYRFQQSITEQAKNFRETHFVVLKRFKE